MNRYDFESMGGIWKDTAQKITKNGVFVAHDGSWGSFGSMPGRFTLSQ